MIKEDGFVTEKYDTIFILFIYLKTLRDNKIKQEKRPFIIYIYSQFKKKNNASIFFWNSY